MLTFTKQDHPQVLLVGNFLSSTFGTRGVCEDLAVALKSAGWSVLTTSERPGRFSRLLDFLLTVCRRRHHYEVAHIDVYSGFAFVWAELVCLALRMVKKPYVLTLHGGNLPVFARNSGQRVRRLLLSSSAVTTPSLYLFEQMRPYRKDLVLIPNPLNLSRYTFTPQLRPAPNLVWLRAFHRIYNPSLAVQVVAHLTQNFPNVRLIMIGPDKGDGSREATENMAVKLGVTKNVKYTGQIPKDEIPNCLQQANIFLNTSQVDNTPVSVLEAMACGLCVISTNVGGIPYLLRHNVDALLVPPDDPVSMANAIRRVLCDNGLAEKLSRNARRKAEQLDWKEILPKWESLLISVAKGSTMNG